MKLRPSLCLVLHPLSSFLVTLQWLTPTTHAWNATGHMIIASLAYDQLSPAQRAPAQAVLTKLADFNGTNGQNPTTGLVLASDGNLYGTSQADGLLTITFDDGSTMKVKTAPSNANSAATGGKILKVRQGGTELDLDLEGGSTLKIITAEETSSVMLRDKAGRLEYAD